MVRESTVKVTGISSRIRKPDLAAKLKVHVSDIIIPKHQQQGQHRFAYINNFESESEANDFVMRWDGVFLESNSRICLRCEVIISETERKKRAQINVKESLQDIYVLLGQDGRLAIESEAVTPPQITWTFNGIELKNSTKYNIVSRGNISTLTVHNCDHADVGEYHVILANTIHRIEQTGILHIRIKPKVEAVRQNNEQSCLIGQNAQMTWKFSGIEKPHVTWYFGKQPLEKNNRFEITTSADGESTLIIREVQNTDSGVYTAQATNSVGTAAAQTTLSVVGTKPVIIRDLQPNVYLMTRQKFTLQLVVSGTPKPEIVWMQNNNVLIVGKQIHVTSTTDGNSSTHQMVIENVQIEHQGQYSAKVENRIGSLISSACKLTVTPDCEPCGGSTPTGPQIRKETIQSEKKAYYDSFTDIDNISNQEIPSLKQAEAFTKSILNTKPSGNVTERTTACHIINKLLASGEQTCLFYDSKNHINFGDASAHLAAGSENEPVVLILKSSQGLGGDHSQKTYVDEQRFVEILNNCIKQGGYHPASDDILNRLAKVHDVNKSDIVLKELFVGSFGIVYTIKNLRRIAIDKIQSLSNKLKSQFEQFVKAKIHPLLYRPSFDISNFDERGNKTFGAGSETHQLGPPGKTKIYTSPAGWTRYGLKVLGKYDTDTWLHPFGDPGNWYRAFHGTGRAQQVDFGGSMAPQNQQSACVDACASIHQNEFRVARVAAYGPGVYCSPNPKFPEAGYVGTVELDTTQGRKKFKCMLQVAVNPNGVQFTSHNDIWVVPDPKDIRSYGILIKQA